MEIIYERTEIMQTDDEFEEIVNDITPDVIETSQANIELMAFWLASFYHQLEAKGLAQAQAFTLTRDWQQHLQATSPAFTKPFI